MNTSPTPFTLDVIRLVRGIPRGRVATYGQIAELAGRPWASRGVSMVLHARGRIDELPWQRVVGAGGRIKFAPGSAPARRQILLLKGDGVAVAGGGVDLQRFGWKKKAAGTPGPPRPKMFG